MISESQLAKYCIGDVTEIENYSEAVDDKTQKWHCHHRKELTTDGKFQYSMKDLKELGLYYGRPPSELIFLTRSEHRKLHAKARSDEHREKIGASNSKANKGKKIKPHTAEHRENLRKHKDITVSQLDDMQAYQRAYREKKKSLTAK